MILIWIYDLQMPNFKPKYYWLLLLSKVATSMVRYIHMLFISVSKYSSGFFYLLTQHFCQAFLSFFSIWIDGKKKCLQEFKNHFDVLLSECRIQEKLGHITVVPSRRLNLGQGYDFCSFLVRATYVTDTYTAVTLDKNV